MKKAFIATTTAAALALATAAPAQAGHQWYTWTYDLSWGGPPTMLITEYAGWDTHVELAVDGFFSGIGYAPEGQYIGVDPHIDPDLGTGVRWASCELRIEGITVATDYAQAGDGTDVICTAFA
jgi:hypothetical protein